MRDKILVFLGAACYGGLSTIVTEAYRRGYSLSEVVGSQMLTGFVLIWLAAFLLKLLKKLKKKNRRTDTAASCSEAVRLTWRQRGILLAAGIPTAVTGLLYYQSLHYIQNSLAVVLLFQFTWIGVLLQTLFQRERPQRMVVLALPVLFAGTLLAAGVFEHGTGAGYDWRGVVFGLSAAVSYSVFIFLSGRTVPAADPVQRTGWMITGGMLLVFLLFPPDFLTDGTLLAGLLPYGFSLGFIGVFLPPLLFVIGVPHIGEGTASVLGAAELPVAVLLSGTVLHEHISAVQWCGIFFILLGVAFPVLKRDSCRTDA